ncbi:MAG: hypothetical protein JHD03_08855, partial [Solirubrobacteraceae bacterium]|nr:hypothetical protein [Solirubrobacteraceae bacterium]
MTTLSNRPLRSATKTVLLTAAASLLCLSFASAASADTLTGTVLTNSAAASGVTVTVYGAGTSSATTLGSAVTSSTGAFTVTYTPPAAGLVYAMTQDASGRRREM